MPKSNITATASMSPLPQIEVAAFYVVSEALTNVVYTLERLEAARQFNSRQDYIQQRQGLSEDFRLSATDMATFQEALLAYAEHYQIS